MADDKGPGLKESLEAVKMVGEMAWAVVKASEGSSSVSGPHLSVLPEAAKSAMDLVWPKKESSMEMKIHWPREFFDAPDRGTNITLLVQWGAGGQYKGKGKYISDASVSPTHIDVQVFNTLDVNCAFSGARNVGTDTDPIAWAKLIITVKLGSNIHSYSGFICGDGSGELG